MSPHHITASPHAARALLVALSVLAGCGRDGPAVSPDAGTTAELQLPESNPPVLTRAVADRIRPGMPQEAVLSLLRDAARDTPSARSSLETVSTQGKLNNIRYNLTVSQGKGVLKLAFKDAALVDKEQSGLE